MLSMVDWQFERIDGVDTSTDPQPGWKKMPVHRSNALTGIQEVWANQCWWYELTCSIISLAMQHRREEHDDEDIVFDVQDDQFVKSDVRKCECPIDLLVLSTAQTRVSKLMLLVSAHSLVRWLEM
jgi:hypothetical protein